MTLVGHVKELWRYPVKSMQGTLLTDCWLTERGVAGDRCWAMRDENRQEVQWGKKYPQLMLCSARYRREPESGDVAPVEITFPDGTTLDSDDPSLPAKLSTLCGTPATLWPLQPASNREFYKRYKPDPAQWAREISEAFAREPGEPQPDFAQFPEVLVDYVAVPGTFFDNEALHIITTASLAAMRAKNPAARWDIRRFRPNLFIETVPGVDGLVEQNWLRRRLVIGEAELEIAAPTPRCGMTTRPQADLPFDKTVLRTIVREGAQNLGVGAHLKVPGRVRSGDAVMLTD